MTTRMIHPQHGAMHAYSDAEIERLRGLGWRPEGEQIPVSQYAEPGELIKLQVVTTPRRGRPPKAK